MLRARNDAFQIGDLTAPLSRAYLLSRRRLPMRPTAFAALLTALGTLAIVLGVAVLEAPAALFV